MTYTTYKTYKNQAKALIPPHGSYQSLESYKNAVIIYDGTVRFCQLYVDKNYKSYSSYKSYSLQSDQMIQAARSGKQNIAEGSAVSGTSKKSELKLVGVARGSLSELLEDFLDFLRQNHFRLWLKDDPQALTVRKLAYSKDRTYTSYKSYIESGNAETAANCLICLIHQTNFLLDRQLESLEKQFLAEGGFTERLYHRRAAERNKTYKSYKTYNK